MPEEIRRARRLAEAAAFAALLAVASYVSFTLPLTDVPFTLQVFVVLLAGAVLGPGAGALSVLVYLLLGALGAPVFAAGSGGLGVLLGPLGGYLLSWPLAAAAAGLGHRRGPALRLLWLIAALALVYLGGVAGLHLGQGIGWRAAVLAGALPFLPFDVLKALVVWALAPQLERLAAPPGAVDLPASAGGGGPGSK